MNENEYIKKLLELRDAVNESREKADAEYSKIQTWIDREICYTEVQIEDSLKAAEEHDKDLKKEAGKFWMGEVA